MARVLYVDIDVHHADGVEGILQGVPNCFCLSIHHKAKGFYPGTGSLRESSGRRGVLNVPVQRGCTDDEFATMLLPSLRAMLRRSQPDGIVLQAGCDGLGQDPTAAWNLTHASYRAVVNYIVRLGLPTVILGGGGYKHSVAARCNAHVVDAAIGACLEHPLQVSSSGEPAEIPCQPGWSALPLYVPPGERTEAFRPSAAESLMRPAEDAAVAALLGTEWVCPMLLRAVSGRESLVRSSHLKALMKVLDEEFSYGASEAVEDSGIEAVIDNSPGRGESADSQRQGGGC